MAADTNELLALQGHDLRATQSPVVPQGSIFKGWYGAGAPAGAAGLSIKIDGADYSDNQLLEREDQIDGADGNNGVAFLAMKMADCSDR